MTPSQNHSHFLPQLSRIKFLVFDNIINNLKSTAVLPKVNTQDKKIALWKLYTPRYITEITLQALAGLTVNTLSGHQNIHQNRKRQFKNHISCQLPYSLNNNLTMSDNNNESHLTFVLLLSFVVVKRIRIRINSIL